MNKEHIFKIGIVIITFIVLSNCDVNTLDGGKEGETILKGIVVDKADSTPLDSVLFSISYHQIMQNSLYMDLSPKTDSTGTFYFEIYCMKDYSYYLNYEKEGYSVYSPLDYPLSIDKAEGNYFYIEMEKDITKTK